MPNLDKLKSIVNSILLTSGRPIVLISGIHGDEPAGNIVAELFRGHKGIEVISGINNTGNRKLDGKDINRHFDTSDQGELQYLILQQILDYHPKLVISLHEDNESSGVYAYTSPVIKSLVAETLHTLGVQILDEIHGDETEEGVITRGKQPFKGTLERALAKRGIPYCTVETPTAWDLKDRTQTQQKIVSSLLEAVK